MTFNAMPRCAGGSVSVLGATRIMHVQHACCIRVFSLNSASAAIPDACQHAHGPCLASCNYQEQSGTWWETLRCGVQAAKSAAHAETAAQEATGLARRARTQAAVQAAGDACQSFHQARLVVSWSACACTCAALLMHALVGVWPVEPVKRASDAPSNSGCRTFLGQTP